MDAKNATSTTMTDHEFITYFPKRKKPRFLGDCIIDESILRILKPDKTRKIISISADSG